MDPVSGRERYAGALRDRDVVDAHESRGRHRVVVRDDEQVPDGRLGVPEPSFVTRTSSRDASWLWYLVPIGLVPLAAENGTRGVACSAILFITVGLVACDVGSISFGGKFTYEFQLRSGRALHSAHANDSTVPVLTYPGVTGKFIVNKLSLRVLREERQRREDRLGAATPHGSQQRDLHVRGVVVPPRWRSAGSNEASGDGTLEVAAGVARGGEGARRGVLAEEIGEGRREEAGAARGRKPSGCVSGTGAEGGPSGGVSGQWPDVSEGCSSWNAFAEGDEHSADFADLAFESLRIVWGAAEVGREREVVLDLVG